MTNIITCNRFLTTYFSGLILISYKAHSPITPSLNNTMNQTNSLPKTNKKDVAPKEQDVQLRIKELDKWLKKTET